MKIKLKFVNGLTHNECHVNPVLTITYPDKKQEYVGGFGIALEWFWFAVLISVFWHKN